MVEVSLDDSLYPLETFFAFYALRIKAEIEQSSVIGKRPDPWLLRI